MDRNKTLLYFTLLCQVVTIWITWELWEVRESVPNFPIVDIPQVPFGAVLLLSIFFTAWKPRVGIWIYGTLLLTAFCFDLIRVQPQFYFLWLLAFGIIYERHRWIVTLLLASLWLWSGLHKWLSYDWFLANAPSMIKRMGFPESSEYFLDISMFYAVSVAFIEVLLGVFTLRKSKYAPVICMAMHSAILIILSPLLYNWNPSVWPWNAALALTGAWMITHTHYPPKTISTIIITVILLIFPAFYYTGHTPSRLSFILYSGNVPTAEIVHNRESSVPSAWELEVPFPDSPMLFERYFEKVSPPNSEMHIQDPRPFSPDIILKKNGQGTVQ